MLFRDSLLQYDVSIVSRNSLCGLPLQLMRDKAPILVSCTMGYSLYKLQLGDESENIPVKSGHCKAAFESIIQ